MVPQPERKVDAGPGPEPCSGGVAGCGRHRVDRGIGSGTSDNPCRCRPGRACRLGAGRAGPGRKPFSKAPRRSGTRRAALPPVRLDLAEALLATEAESSFDWLVGAGLTQTITWCRDNEAWWARAKEHGAELRAAGSLSLRPDAWGPNGYKSRKPVPSTGGPHFPWPRQLLCVHRLGEATIDAQTETESRQ